MSAKNNMFKIYHIENSKIGGQKTREENSKIYFNNNTVLKGERNYGYIENRVLPKKYVSFLWAASVNRLTRLNSARM